MEIHSPAGSQLLRTCQRGNEKCGNWEDPALERSLFATSHNDYCEHNGSKGY